MLTVKETFEGGVKPKASKKSASPQQPGRPVEPTSLTSRLCALCVGDCVAEARQVSPTVRVGEFADMSRHLKAQLRNSIASSIVAAEKRIAPAKFSAETGTFVTAGSLIYLITVIKRER